MSNPNTQKLGKRKMAPGKQQQQPDWLFPGARNPAQNAQRQSKMFKNQEEKIAEDLLKRRAAGELPKPTPPTQLVELVGAFLSEYEYTHTSRSYLSERGSHTVGRLDGLPSLTTIYNEWRQLKDEKNKPVMQNGVKEVNSNVTEETSSSSDSESSSSSEEENSDVEMLDSPPASKQAPRDSSSESSSSDSDSDADDESDAPSVKIDKAKPKINGLKRKASLSSSSSSGSESSSENEAPKAKKTKTKVSSSGTSSSSSSSASNSTSDSDSTSSSDDNVAKVKAGANLSSSDSDSTSSSSESDSSTDSVARKVPLPESDVDLSSSSSSSSESSSRPVNKKKVIRKQGSDTSATLSKKSSSFDSSDSSSSSGSDAEPAITKSITKDTTTSARKLSPPLPPDPAVKFQKKNGKPFSRIPEDIKVEEKFADNSYVPYDYAQKAHEDLIVTKGKGFTKEKNKKKRGSYRGGYIDVEGRKGIKFDD